MSAGIKANNDGSAAIQVGGTDRVTLSSAGVMEVPAGIVANLTGAADKLSTASGSAPSYSARAWVNFNGTGTVAIRASGNVSSITDNGTGDYTVNFATAMPDANYCVQSITCIEGGEADIRIVGLNLNRPFNTTACGVTTFASFSVRADRTQVHAAIFR